MNFKIIPKMCTPNSNRGSPLGYHILFSFGATMLSHHRQALYLYNLENAVCIYSETFLNNYNGLELVVCQTEEHYIVTNMAPELLSNKTLKMKNFLVN